MKRFLVPLLSALLVLALTAPSALAQAPAPKVTITGLFDQISSMGKNFYDSNLTRDNDREWYARLRFRPDFTFEVGRVKAVLGLEIDLGYGQMGATDGGFPGNVTGANQCKVNTNGCLDLNTDVGGMIEIKWVYTEFPLTGKDSVMPFIPVATTARAGGQPWGSLANTRTMYANGDFAGLSTVTTFAPNLNTKLAYVVIEDELAGGNRAAANARTSRGEDWALTASPEYTPIKGLDLKFLYSYLHADGATSGGSRHNTINRKYAGTDGTVATNQTAAQGGGNAAGDSTNQENRHTVGIDLRWRSGPFGLDPAVYYQWGTADHQAKRSNGSIGRVEADVMSWYADLIASFRTGPLLLEARGIYSPGNKARDNLAQSIRYYQPIAMDGGHYAGWAAILANGGIDYFNGSLLTNMARFISYDRYGRAQLGFKGTYSITPAFSVYGWVSPTWTAEKVDTDTGVTPGNSGNTGTGTISRTTVSDQSWVEGDSRYIGTEVDIGFSWRFAPNAALDLQGAYLFAGDAMGTAEVLNGVHTRRDPNDGYMLATRVRLSF